MQPNTEQTDGLWLTLTELAKREGIAKSVASERVTAFEAAGHIKTKPGPRRAKLIELGQYLEAKRLTGDAAKEAGAVTKSLDLVSPPAPDTLAEPAPSASPAYRDVQAREKQIASYLKELELRERLGELIRASEVIDAVQKCGETIVRVIDRLPSNADAMAASVAKDGTLGARARLKDCARDLRKALVVALRDLAKLAPPPVDLDALDALMLDGPIEQPTESGGA